MAQPKEGHGRLGYSSGITVIGVVGVAVVAIEHIVVVGKGGVEETQPAVVLVVAYGDPHGCGFAAVLVQGIAGGVAVVFKGAVAFVDVEVVGGGVVGHQQVYFAVVVEVDEDRGESVVAVGIADSGFLADIGEGAVAVVVEEMVVLSFEPAGAAHHVDAAELAEV